MNQDYNKNALDVFRVIATAQVFLGHIITHFVMEMPPVDLVYFVRGVPILFVLCGFLAAKSLDKYKTIDWLKGRAARIIPGFWACIVVNTAVILLVYETRPSLIEAAIYGVTQFFGLNFFTGDWLRGYGVGTPNGVLWTIPVQIQFFLIAPFVYKLFRRSSLKLAGTIVAALTLLSILLQRASAFLPGIVTKVIGVTVLPYLYFLVAGMAGWCYRDKIIPALQRAKWFVLIGYIIWKLAEIYLQFPHLLDGVLYNTVTTLLMAMLIFAFGFSFKWRMKADLSFGFYLYHMIFVNLAIHFGFKSLMPWWQGAVVLAVIVCATTLFAWLSQRFVETPAAKLLLRKG